MNDLISDMHHPVLRGLCAIWLAQQTSVVGHVKAVFEVSDDTEIEPPTFDKIEAALGRFNSKGIAATRTAIFALLCTRRLGDVGDATDGCGRRSPHRRLWCAGRRDDRGGFGRRVGRPDFRGG